MQARLIGVGRDSHASDARDLGPSSSMETRSVPACDGGGDDLSAPVDLCTDDKAGMAAGEGCQIGVHTLKERSRQL